MSIVLSSFRARLQATERDLAIEALTVTNGGMTAAARLMGVHKYQLRRVVLRHNLQAYVHAQPLGRPAGGNEAWRALADA